MGAGQLRKRVTFEREQRSADGAGGAAVKWVPELTVWGGLITERGRERLEAGRLESANTAILKVRSSSAARCIDASYRAQIDGVSYQVRSIDNPDQRNKYLEMVVERGVAT